MKFVKLRKNERRSVYDIVLTAWDGDSSDAGRYIAITTTLHEVVDLRKSLMQLIRDCRACGVRSAYIVKLKSDGTPDRSRCPHLYAA